MRFEPRILRPDDEPEQELALPADLELLAEQLSDDAAHLAACYPPQPRRARRTVVNRWRWVAAAALVGAVGVWSGLQTLRDPVGLNANISPQWRPVAQAPVGQDAGKFDEMTPASLWPVVNGAEQEGILDLLENEALRQSSLSI